jgi:hypothetical protein
MTPAGALKEARRRWGPLGRVEALRERPTLIARGGPRKGERVFVGHTHRVGRVALGLFFEVLGEGPTFEAAFDDVDLRAARDRDFHASCDEPCPECCATMRVRTHKGTGNHQRHPTWDPAAKRHVCAVCAKTIARRSAVEGSTA